MVEFIKLPYRLLVYDIETELNLRARIWRLGENVIRHTQLDKAFNTNEIICIQYKWYGEKSVHVLSGKDMISKFDALVKQSDATIGKNNARFDVKHINTQRMLQGLPAYPEWTDTSDDLEKQLRKYFDFPSQSLDYISQLLGYGGKIKMEWDDWRLIGDRKHLLKYKESKLFNMKQLNFIAQTECCNSYTNVITLGLKALKKMFFYGKKDVRDTEKVLQRVMPYIKLKYNASNSETACTVCGHNKIVPTKIIIAGKTKYQQFYCPNHDGYAGRATYKYDKQRHKVFGKMGN